MIKLKSVRKTLIHVGLLSLVLTVSCTTTSESEPAPDEFLESIDPGTEEVTDTELNADIGTVEDIDSELPAGEDVADAAAQSLDSLDREQPISDSEIPSIGEDIESDVEGDLTADTSGEVEDFSIAKDYEAFDPAGIVVRFPFDSADLSDETIGALDRIVAGLKKDELARIFVRGHADKQGPAGYNDVLSEKRSQAIKNYLVKNGISEERLIPVHLGENEPLVAGDTVSAFRQNRRGDFNLDYGTGAFGK